MAWARAPNRCLLHPEVDPIDQIGGISEDPAQERTGKLDAYEGGLMAYTDDWNAVFDRAAALVDRILKGAKPADLPVERPTNFKLIVNMKTAQTLRLTLPPSIRLRADHVIE